MGGTERAMARLYVLVTLAILGVSLAIPARDVVPETLIAPHAVEVLAETEIAQHQTETASALAEAAAEAAAELQKEFEALQLKEGDKITPKIRPTIEKMKGKCGDAKDKIKANADDPDAQKEWESVDDICCLINQYMDGGHFSNDRSGCDEAFPSAPAPAPAPVEAIENNVLFDNYEYAALDRTDPDSFENGCQNDYITLPSGWEVAPYSDSVVENVVEEHPWGTHVMVFSNGDGYGTSQYNSGKWNGGQLSQEGNSYKPNSCHLRVLIRSPNQGAGAGAGADAYVSGIQVKYAGKSYMALDGTDPTDTSNGCQENYQGLPSGWVVAPYSDSVVENVVETYPWGTHVMVFSNGDGYGTSAYSKGKWKGGQLSQEGNSYKPNSCHLRILIVEQ